MRKLRLASLNNSPKVKNYKFGSNNSLDVKAHFPLRKSFPPFPYNQASYFDRYIYQKFE